MRWFSPPQTKSPHCALMSLHVERGIVLECDPAIKQFILSVEAQRTIFGGRKFVLQDLGDVGLFVQEGVVPEIQSEIDKMLDRNTYQDRGDDD
eukprot:m.85454 g.85454  ORF g.85454 m.85454 type:complete len:93 (-) comp8386_c0_seq1:287-565(-)